MAFSTAGGGPCAPQMNVTPLIDVLLVLIIVFMVVVSMSKRQGVKAQIPQQSKQEAAPETERTIVIQVVWDKTGQHALVKINQEEIPWDKLEARLNDIYKFRAERVAFVSGDDDLDFQYVAEVIAMAHEAGVERVGLLTAPKS